MKPGSNQPARFYRTAKTYKFENLEDIIAANLNFWSIINQTGTFTYNAEKIILDYLRPLSKNEYSINEAKKLSSMSFPTPLLQDDEENVSSDV